MSEIDRSDKIAHEAERVLREFFLGQGHKVVAFTPSIKAGRRYLAIDDYGIVLDVEKAGN